MGEVLSPRAEAMGPAKYKEMIRKRSKEADEKNLPFQVIKKSKQKSCTKGLLCVCKKKVHWVNTNTYMIACSSCGTVVKTADMSPIDDVVSPEINMSNFKGQDQKLAPFTKKKIKGKGTKWV